MKTQITGVLTFMGGIGAFILNLNFIDEPYILPVIGFVCAISSCLYVYWTNFGRYKEIMLPEIKKVEEENKLLKSKIEQKKLRKELEED